MTTEIPNGKETHEEQFGPKVGVHLDFDQADLIMKRHLGMSCKSFLYLDRGYNNRVYTLLDEDDNEYIVRLGGRFWTKTKTENDVAATLYLQLQYGEKIRTPKILGFCSSRELSGINAEYILMEKIIGCPLDEVWDEMSTEDKIVVCKQIVPIVGIFQNLAFSKIGGLGFKSELSDTFGIGINPRDIKCKDIVSSKLVDHGVGPFDSYLSYYKGICDVEIAALKKCKVMKPQQEKLDRITKFVEAITNSESSPLSKEVQNPSIVFHHGDLDLQNILVRGTEVTGILDFEFSGSAPIDNEWCECLEEFGVRSNEIELYDMKPLEQSNEEYLAKRKNLVPVRKAYFDEIGRLGITAPEKIVGFVERAQLHFFMCNICPWFLREEDREVIPDDWYEQRDLAVRRVEYMLQKYGF